MFAVPAIWVATHFSLGLMQASTPVQSKTQLPRIAVFLSRDNPIKSSKADLILASIDEPDTKTFVVLKGKKFEIVVDRQLIDASKERTQLEAFAYLLKQMRTTKRAVAIKDLPKQILEGISGLMGSGLPVSTSKGQVRIEPVISVDFDGQGSPSTTVDLRQFDPDSTTPWNPFESGAQASGENAQQPPSAKPDAKDSATREAELVNELRIVTSKEMPALYRYQLLGEAMKLLLEARIKAMEGYYLALIQLGKEMALADPMLSKWADQNAKRFGDLPSQLQSELVKRARQNPYWHESSDMANRKISITPCIAITMADQAGSSHAIIITMLRG
jgi:hypothetical protein